MVYLLFDAILYCLFRGVGPACLAFQVLSPENSALSGVFSLCCAIVPCISRLSQLGTNIEKLYADYIFVMKVPLRRTWNIRVNFFANAVASLRSAERITRGAAIVPIISDKQIKIVRGVCVMTALTNGRLGSP